MKNSRLRRGRNIDSRKAVTQVDPATEFADRFRQRIGKL
jgi:hypothetical protein